MLVCSPLSTLFIGISLACKDTTLEGIVDRKYEYSRAGCSTIELVRATITKAGACPPSDADGFNDNGVARATFSSPVMSRRHARILIDKDGTVRRYLSLHCRRREFMTPHPDHTNSEVTLTDTLCHPPAGECHRPPLPPWHVRPCNEAGARRTVRYRFW